MEAIDKENPSSEFASVSVIIPCYQCSNTIKRAVDSVINQILKPAELILIDDYSKDNTLDILKNLQNIYGVDWIKVVSLESNSGPSVARNRGWEIATQKNI